MTRLIIVRHGQTDWNNVNRIQGEVDVPLNSEGLKEAKCLASQLSSEKIDVVFSSELSRSYVTAEEVARHHKLKVKRVISVLRNLIYGFPEQAAVKVEAHSLNPAVLLRSQKISRPANLQIFHSNFKP